MLCTANVESQFPKIAALLGLKGAITDFNVNWFTNIGDTIVGSLKFNIFFPVVMEVGWFSLRLLKRILDKTSGDDENEASKSGTIYQYINKHAGPQYFMHYKYSAIMNVVYLTMMFGPAMPILFPICFGSLAVQYTLEMSMLYYVYKQPPSYDDKLNNRVLKNLGFAPLLMLSMSFWMFSSPMLLGTYDSMKPIKTMKDPFDA